MVTLEHNNYVYILCDPRIKGIFKYKDIIFNNEPFYVGRANGTYNRERQHFNLIYLDKKNSYKTNKIRMIKEETNLYPISIRINGLTFEESCILETYLINIIGRYDLKYGSLTNRTNGGERNIGYRHTIDTKIKMSFNRKGKKLSLNHRNKLSLSHTGFKHTNESKQKMSRAQIGHKVSYETRKKLRCRMLGKRHSFISKQKMSYSQTGIKNGMFGKKHSESTKCKISNKLKGKFAGCLNPFYGKKHNLNSIITMKAKLSRLLSGIGNPMYGKHHSEITKRLIRNNNNSKEWIIITPDDKIIYVKGLNGFCKEYGLKTSSMNALGNKKSDCKTHHGFSCFLYTNFINLYKDDITINDKILKWIGGKEYGKF